MKAEEKIAHQRLSVLQLAERMGIIMSIQDQH